MRTSLKHFSLSVFVLLGLLSLVSSQERVCSKQQKCPRNQLCLPVGRERKCVRKGTCAKACGKGSKCRLTSLRRVECTKCPAGSQLVLKRCLRNGGTGGSTQGVWAAWGPWSSCSVTCGSGTEERKRSCHNSACPCSCTGIGNSTQTRPCHTHIAICELGQWTSWESWSECSKSDDGCNRTRVRKCKGGYRCEGSKEISEKCDAKKCPEWGKWSAWSKCSASCLGGLKSRNRVCSGDVCIGNNTDIELCNNIPCKEPSDVPLTDNKTTENPLNMTKLDVDVSADGVFLSIEKIKGDEKDCAVQCGLTPNCNSFKLQGAECELGELTACTVEPSCGNRNIELYVNVDTVNCERKPRYRYEIVRGKIVYEAAEPHCISRGGHLASVSSDCEFETLKIVISESQIQNGLMIGYHDRNRDGTWEWTDGTITNYQLPWRRTEPNGPRYEHCVWLNGFGEMSDYQCNLRKEFICKFIEE